MPFTEQQLTSALATYLSKKKKFSSTKKTVYLYPFTDSAGGQDGVQWRTVGRHLYSVQYCDCADTRNYENTDGKLAWFSLTITFFNLFFNDFSDIKALLTLSLHGAVFIWSQVANSTLHFYHQVYVFMRNTCGSLGVKGNSCNTF